MRQRAFFNSVALYQTLEITQNLSGDIQTNSEDTQWHKREGKNRGGNLGGKKKNPFSDIRKQSQENGQKLRNKNLG